MIGDNSQLQKQMLGRFASSDSSRTVFAGTYDQAMQFFFEEEGERHEGDLSVDIFVPKKITQKEIDNGEIDDMNAETGQTWYFSISSNDRPLKEGELRGFSI